MKRLTSLFMLLAGFTVFCLAGDNALATGMLRAEGTLTSVEIDGSVVIDENGYIMDPSAQILNSEGKQVPLNSLSLPVRVYFEYKYTKKGPVIRLMKEYPKVIPE